MARIKRSNLSTEHQRPGDAKRPQDTLDRERPQDEQAEVGRKRPDRSPRPTAR